MRRLRALLSAGRKSRAAVATALVGVPGHAGGVGRRNLLGLIAAAPVALPAAVRAAAEPRFITLGMDVQRAGSLSGAAVLYEVHGKIVARSAQDNLDTYFASGGVPLQSGDLTRLRVGQDSGSAEARQRFISADTVMDPLSSTTILQGGPTCLLIDDVGSGP